MEAAHPTRIARQLVFALAAATVSVGTTWAQGSRHGASYEGTPVPIGNGSAHTVVRTDGGGKAVSVGIVFTETALEGLPAPTGDHADVAFHLPMPAQGPRTVIDHAVVNWEASGHPPPKVYDVPHFDFHFYLVGRSEQEGVRFRSDAESGDPGQQPPARLIPAGYVVPPGTAVPQMGVHAVNPGAPEFHGRPFTATFIYGFHDRKQTFLEPMASLAFLKSRPDFSAPVVRPADYEKAGAYPSSYSVKYDSATRTYEVSLDGLR